MRRPAILGFLALGLALGPEARAQDADGDLVPDDVEDRDGDGLLDDNDTDEDSIPDWHDPDDDGDGVPTRDEDFDGDGDPTDDDLDADERPDYLDTSSPLDVDHDGYVAAAYGGDDCDDDAPGTHPDAYDAWYDGEDWNCLGDDDYDADADGFRDLYRGDGTDCDDDDPDVYPGAPEDLGPVDYDCDGFSDPAGRLGPRGGCNCGVSGLEPSVAALLAGAALGGLRRSRR